jgi:hypothetical protein
VLLNLLPNAILGLYIFQIATIFVENRTLHVWLRRLTATVAWATALSIIGLAAKEMEDKRIFLI